VRGRKGLDSAAGEREMEWLAGRNPRAKIKICRELVWARGLGEGCSNSSLKWVFKHGKLRIVPPRFTHTTLKSSNLYHTILNWFGFEVFSTNS
jgi:hypothetical protein